MSTDPMGYCNPECGDDPACAAGCADYVSLGGDLPSGALGDLSKSPPVVSCPITRLDCVQGCVNQCVSGNLRTPAPKPAEALPYAGALDYDVLGDVVAQFSLAASKLAHWNGSYRHGLCSERCERASEAVRHALSGLDIFLGDEGAAAVLAARKETQ